MPFVTVESMMIESALRRRDGAGEGARFFLADREGHSRHARRLGRNADEAFTKISYERLKPSTAQQVLRFHKMQQQPATAEA